MTVPSDLPFGSWTWVGWRKHKFNGIHQVVPMCPHADRLVQPDEYDLTVRLRRRCSLMSNYFDHLFYLKCTLKIQLLLLQYTFQEYLYFYFRNKIPKSFTFTCYASWILCTTLVLMCLCRVQTALSAGTKNEAVQALSTGEVCGVRYEGRSCLSTGCLRRQQQSVIIAAANHHHHHHHHHRIVITLLVC